MSVNEDAIGKSNVINFDNFFNFINFEKEKSR